MKKQIGVWALLIVFMLGLLYGCQSSDDSDDSADNESSTTTTTDSSNTYSGIAVDPYIVGAVFCEDKNGNEVCDADEQVSTASSATGVFTFSEAVTEGSTVIIKTQGTHNGVPYTLNISRKIDSTTDVSNQVVSPVTTLGTKGLSNSQIATMLQTAGLSDITEADVTSDPMSGISAMTGSLTEPQLAKIRSSIAVYAMLKIMNGSTTLSALTGTELYVSATTDGQPVYEILSVMVEFVKTGLAPSILTEIQDGISAAPVAIPEVTAEDVTRSAVAITDYVAAVGYETCNDTSGDAATKVTAALAEVNSKTNSGSSIGTWAMELGQNFYGARNKTELEPYVTYMSDFQDVVDGTECESGTFVINSSGSVECYTQ